MVPPSDVIKAIAGAWVLINNTILDANGTYRDPSTFGTGANPAGLLMYTPGGYMSASIEATEPAWRPTNISWPTRDNDSVLDSDWASVGRHTLSYAGNYSVRAWNATHGNITHGPLLYAYLPNMVGTRQERNYTLLEGGNMLYVNAINTKDGSVGALYWRKADQKNISEIVVS
ncbi:hypothetical protein K491DRAFT_692195 [Lophiostoma macrostomum CBS 122681]|uniref:Lipocalin-like domain-containing protein n=1 Tax=Lophiostoma macrostomum CBS 122681 TaxID=1314788 RepID=A0A6A6T942_9PLEO|nr:hypothetical protein K491DRAFT_692195 [Lophiostoma macrostomum CBS 122681]